MQTTISSKIHLKWFAGIILSMSLAGCGSGETIPRATINGSVTFDGAPVNEGVIMFIPVVGVKGAPVQLNIKDGTYNSATDSGDKRGVVIGKNDVRIMATRPSGKKVKSPDNEMMDEIVQYIPAKYNEKTELQLEIKAGAQEHNFELKK
ncbi:hypothetical protein [Planctomicrobium sp. SH527]|uniref:hypothetical protein n=1 Tax=Planctomicrobium sp. SH527 TaxID=3448123 RepID=UPI003F5C513F